MYLVERGAQVDSRLLKMSKPLSVLSIPPQILASLNKAGYMTVEDLEGVSSEGLASGKNTIGCLSQTIVSNSFERA